MSFRTDCRAARCAFIVAILVGVAFPASPLGAQDTQYWANSYGTQARLLGGTVIGSDPDISAVFYNPGALALEENLQLLISLNALQYSAISYSSPGISTKIPTNTAFSALPNLIAGVIRIGGKDSPERLAYSILTRQNYTFTQQIRGVQLDSFLPTPPPPPTTAIGNALANQALTETWAGLTFATFEWKALGVRRESVRDHSRANLLAVGDRPGRRRLGAAALAAKEYDFSYYNWALLAKLGVQYRDAEWLAGVTVTTPRLDLFGGSDAGASQSDIDQGLTGAGRHADRDKLSDGAGRHISLSIFHWRRLRAPVEGNGSQRVG